MPGGDRSGPLGQGPMTGKGAGYGAGFGMPGYMNFSGGGFFGRGFGRGRRYATPHTAQNEVEMLRQQEKFLENSLEEIRKRLEQLETSRETDK